MAPERQLFSAFARDTRGMTLIEVMVVVGIMSVVTLGMMTMLSNQLRANNFLEFQLKRTQISSAITGQFLGNPNNCACLFNGAAQFPASGTAILSGVTPNQIGQFSFATPGNCGTATIPAPLVNDTGLDGIKTTSIQLKNLTMISPNSYAGTLSIGLESLKEVQGPKDLSINIPVSVATTTDPSGNMVFKSCSFSSAAAGGGDPSLATMKKRADIPASFESPTYGGGGGYASSRSTCRSNSFMSGVTARTGGGVDRLNAQCATTDGLVSTGGVIGGSGGGTPMAAACPSGSFASGIHGAAGSYVQTFGLDCTDYTTGATSSSGIVGGSGGSPFSWSCPTGTYIFELISTSGGTMDSIQAICATP